MGLFRVHAYTVDPARTVAAVAGPLGGAIPITPDLLSVLERSHKAARFDLRALVDFIMDEDTGTNQVREKVIEYGFGTAAESYGAAACTIAVTGRSMCASMSA